MSGGLLRPGTPGRGPKGAGIFQRPETLPSLLLVFVCGLFCFAVALYGQSQTHSAALPPPALPASISTSTQVAATPVSTTPRGTPSGTAIAVHGGSLADSPPDYGVAASAYRATAPIPGLEEASLRGGPIRPLDLKADSASNAPLIPTATASPSPRPTATPSATATPTTIPTATPIATPIPIPTATPIALGGRTEQVWITGYTLGGTTATGTQAGPGVCAVDPSYIALGTTITIDGVGTCQAQDTGSAVIGAHIDVWVPSDDVAYSITGWHTAHW